MSGIFSIIGGKAGSAINKFGQSLGNPLPDFGISERLEYGGSKPLTTQQRIDKSMQNTGAIAEGDYKTAVNMGYSPTTPSRADGGILTNTQMSQNNNVASGAVLGANDSAVDLSNPVKQTDYARSQGFDSWDQYQQAVNNQNNPEQPDLYGEIGRAFDEVLGGLGDQQASLEGNIRSSADIQKSGINEQLGYGMENLDTQRGNVRTNQANTLADLAQSLRDQAKNVNMFLGAKGVGGSANEAASFALQKLFGRERAGVQRQGMAQLGEIDTAENNLKAKASEMMNSVETWANTQMSSIAQQFNELRNNIGMMKGNMRAQAIESLYNQYNQVQAMKQNYAMSIAQAAQDRLAQLNNLKLELQGTSNFDPRQMVFSEYGFNPGTSYSPANLDDNMFNPMAMAKRRDETV